MRGLRKFGPTSQRSWILLGIIALAVMFRFHNLDITPPGLFFDEALEGNQALEALATGRVQLVYQPADREPLFVWLSTIPLRLFGNRPWAIRSVSAAAGLLTVIGVFVLCSSVYGQQTAVVAAVLLASSFWHSALSRVGLRVILAPLFAVWAIYFFIRAVERKRLADFAIAGAVFGFGFYGYSSYRAMPAVVILGIYAYWRTGRIRRFQPLVAGALAVAIVVAPLGLHFYSHREELSTHASNLVVSSTDEFLSNVAKTLGMFNYEGDRNPRHNVPGKPVLPLGIGLLFVAGIALAIVRRQQASEADYTMLAWLFVGLIPAVITNEAPHAARSLIVAPVVYIFAAKAAVEACVLLQSRMGMRAASVALFALLVTTAVMEWTKYFNVWAKQPVVQKVFFTDDVRIGETLNAMRSTRPVYVYVAPTHGFAIHNGLPLNAQTLMFVTDTYTAEKQRARNIHYSMLPHHPMPGEVIVSIE